MQGNEVNTAFEILLEEIELLANQLHKDGAQAFKAGSYDTARRFIEEATQLAEFREKVKALQKEWASLLAKRPRRPKKAGRVQLIDATQWFKPLRKNLGKKNFELSDEDIARICDTFLKYEETEQSKLFPNAAFGYWKVTVERPLRPLDEIRADILALEEETKGLLSEIIGGRN